MTSGNLLLAALKYLQKKAKQPIWYFPHEKYSNIQDFLGEKILFIFYPLAMVVQLNTTHSPAASLEL